MDNKYLSHRLTKRGACNSGEIRVDARSYDDHDDESKEPAGADGHEDTEGLQSHIQQLAELQTVVGPLTTALVAFAASSLI